MLRELGQGETNPPRGAEAEQAREERMAASMDAELSRLVAARSRSRRTGGFVLAAAALVLLGLGVQHLAPGASTLAISQEPLSQASRPTAAAVVPNVPATPVDSASNRARSPLRTIASAPVPPASSSAASAAASASATPQSTLAEENQWFKEAAEASRNGDVNGALGRLEQLLREHPQSPLAQTALVRKFRLLAKAGRSAEARHEAERYLSAYPTGFAVSEAQALQRGTEAPPSAVEHQDP
jgi:hypothetical protein